MQIKRRLAKVSVANAMNINHQHHPSTTQHMFSTFPPHNPSITSIAILSLIGGENANLGVHPIGERSIGKQIAAGMFEKVNKNSKNG